MTSEPRLPEWLAAFQELAAISDPAWREALRAAKELQLPHGTTVVRRGDPCQSFLLVLEGTIRVYENSEGGREISLYRTCGGELCILTLSGLFASGHYAAEARTDGAVRVAAIPVALFRRALGESEAFRDFILATLVRRLSDVMRLVDQVTFQHLDLRLACLLGHLFERNRSPSLSTTHEELARELGTDRVVVSRILKEFERMGCIRLRWRRIELVSPEALARQARVATM